MDHDDDDWGEPSQDDRLASCPDQTAARELRSLMSEISEDHYAAGWLIGLEFSLWRLIFETPEDTFGFSTLTLEDRSRLIELTYRCQGWWVYSKIGRQFLTYDEWLPLYQRGPKASF